MNSEPLAEKLVLWIKDKVSAAGCRGGGSRHERWA